MKQKCTMPKCKGFHSIQPTVLGWLEVCTTCKFRKLHHNRRIKQEPIEFKDRRTHDVLVAKDRRKI